MRLVRPYRTGGEGRTESGLPHATALSKPILMPLAWSVVAVMASLSFVFSTTTVGRVGPSVVAGTSAIASGLLVLLVHGAPSRRQGVSGSGPWVLSEALPVALATVAATLVSPLIILANRSSDAPAGSVVAFWTTVFAGSLLAAVGVVSQDDRLRRVASLLLLLTAGAGVLANWERPSSFSLLVRYVEAQSGIVTGVVLWVVAVAYLSHRFQRGGTRVTLIASSAAILSGLALPLFYGLAWTRLMEPRVLLAAGASAVLFLMVLSLGPGRGGTLSGSAIAVAPAVITLFTLVESAVGVLGPRPILLAQVLACVAVGVSALAMLFAPSAMFGARAKERPLGLIALLALIAAGLGMITPAIDVVVRGGLSSGQAFEVGFSMLGYETVAAWLAFALALLVFVSARRSGSGSGAALLLAASMITVFAWWTLRDVPLHTWVSWIPAEVQQDYGTEFASMVMKPAVAVWQMIALGSCLVAAGTNLMLVRMTGTLDNDSQSPLVEGRS